MAKNDCSRNESKYARKYRLKKEGLISHGWKEDEETDTEKYESNKELSPERQEKNQIPEPINYFCKRFRIETKIYFSRK